MSLTAFPYPGGKTPYANQIISYFPQHDRYVEPFGGGGSILLNKPASHVEVYNDYNNDVVHFFRVLREHREELENWLEYVPFSRELYDRWRCEYREGLRPADDIERAGRWYALRYMSFGGDLDGRGGFKASGKRNDARRFRNSIDELDAVAKRFDEVVIECEDYQEVIDRYDNEDSLFYLDPPYLEDGDRYYETGQGFDHERLMDALSDVKGYWICSYGALPDGLESNSITVREFTARYGIEEAVGENKSESVERLAMNFDPDTEPAFSGPEQATLGFTVEADGGDQR